MVQLQTRVYFALILGYELHVCSLLQTLLRLKYRTAVKSLFLYFILYLSVMLYVSHVHNLHSYPFLLFY